MGADEENDRDLGRRFLLAPEHTMAVAEYLVT